jgi:hypothetical protein
MLEVARTLGIPEAFRYIMVGYFRGGVVRGRSFKKPKL